MKRAIFLAVILTSFCISCPAQEDNPFFVVTVDGKQGFIDKAGKIIIEPQFSQCSYQTRFVDGLAKVCTKDSDKAGFIDKTGKFVIEQKFNSAQDFSEGLAIVYFGEFRMHRGYDKAGFIDKTGRLVVEPIYDAAMNFSEGLAAVRKEGKSGFIDKTGKIAIPLQFDYAFNFSEGLAVVFVNGKYGFVDKAGNIIITPQFTDARNFSDGIALVRIGGPSIFPYPYRANQEQQAIGKLNRKYAYINKTGQIISSFAANDAGSFSDGLAAVLTLDGYGFINKNGKYSIQPKFPNVFGMTPHFAEGLAITILKNNKIGFINKKGKTVIRTEYIYGYNFENGLALICEEVIDTCGYIGKTGKVIWKPTK